MTREEAIDVYNGLINTKIKEAFEFFAPELRENESEDERIRKALIELVGLTPDYMFGEIKPNKFIAYLEKQKEHQNNFDAPNESSWSGMISSSDKDKNLDEIAQDYVDGVKEYNPEPTWDLVQTAVCYGYYLAEQKEQKPNDGPLNDPKFIKGFDTGREVQRIFDEKKPAEWSENDTVFLNEIIDFFENKTVKLQHDIDMYAHWLKLLPERFNLQPKQEWSEEDEKIITRLIDYFESFRIAGVATKWEGLGVQEVITLLKSLRPSWKPSEEQMEALKDTLEVMPEFVKPKCTLEGLYIDLKKL